MAYSLANVLNQPSVHIFLWEEDGAWVAKCLDIPGCVSQGTTRDEALANIHDAIALCLDVIREDQTSPISGGPKVELIERPMSDFLQTS